MEMIRDLVGLLAREVGQTEEDVDALFKAAGALGIQVDDLRLDVLSLLRQRLFMWMVGEVRTDLNFSERKRLVAKRLTELLRGSTGRVYCPTDAIVITIAEIQGSIAEAPEDYRLGTESVDESTWNDIIQRQSFRCAVCGVPLRENAVRSSSRHVDNREPVGSPHLDHKLPFYLLGNRGGLEILCSGCNLLKNDRLGVQEDGYVVGSNFLRRRNALEIKRRMAFWTLYCRRTCEHSDCVNGPWSSMLYVERRRKRLPLAYGNLICYCDEHASNAGQWLHEIGAERACAP